jgi:hypothetical protein
MRFPFVTVTYSVRKHPFGWIEGGVRAFASMAVPPWPAAAAASASLADA